MDKKYEKYTKNNQLGLVQSKDVLQSDITRPKFYSFRYNGALICMPDKRSPVSGLLPDQNCRIRKLKNVLRYLHTPCTSFQVEYSFAFSCFTSSYCAIYI